MNHNMFKSLGCGVAVLTLALGLVACSGSSKAPAAQTGQFVDAQVVGANYSNTPSGLSGVTDNNGNYNYLPGDIVTFSIGNIVFPSTTAKGTVTPFDLAGIEYTPGTTVAQVTNSVVINISRLLQTLDTDGNPDNGITLDSSVTGSAYNFNQSVASFQNDFKADFPTLSLVSVTNTLTHLISQLEALSSGTAGAGILGPNETAAVIPAALVKSYDLTYSESSTGSGITDGTMTNFVVGSDNSLTIDGSNKLINPVFYLGNDREAIWTDEANNLAYALSDVQGTFNEINVSNAIAYDQSGFVFYGQYRLPPSSTPFSCPDTFGSLVITSDDPEGITLLGGGDICPKSNPTGSVSTGALIWSDSWFPEYPDRKRGSITFQTSGGETLAASSPTFFQIQVDASNGGTWRQFVNPGTLADFGIVLNTVDKTVTFTNTDISAVTVGSFPGTGTLTLNGTLKYLTP